MPAPEIRAAAAPVVRQIAGMHRPPPVTLHVNGVATDAYPGQTLAAALLGAGVTVFGRSPSGAPRRMMCNMGVCFDCLVTVNGQPAVRSCLTRVCAGMRVQTAA